MIAKDQAPIRTGDKILAWNMQTYFLDETDLVRGSLEAPKELLRVRFMKLDDEDPKWAVEDFRSVDVTPNQVFLMDDGSERAADDLRAGDRLQNMCGNGHVSQVESVIKIEPRGSLWFKLAPHPWFVARGGVILKESGGA